MEIDLQYPKAGEQQRIVFSGVELLFPGYLVIPLADDANGAPLRSTRGANRLVGFGGMPLKVGERFIEQLQRRCENTVLLSLQLGDGVRITTGDLSELDAIFKAMDGDERAAGQCCKSSVVFGVSLGKSIRQAGTMKVVSIIRKPTVNPGAVVCLNEVKPLAVERCSVRY